MVKSRIYLACPYSDPNPAVRWHRYKMACLATVEIMRKGGIVFSPVTHSHYLAELYNCSSNEAFWREWYLSFLEHWATDLYVLQLIGWEKSKGIAIEMKYAEEHCIPIYMWE